MVIGSRLAQASKSQFRALNRFGNKLFLRLLHLIFGVRLTDLLSGYRCFSRRLVRGPPVFGGGFETEAETTIKALHGGLATVELPVAPRAPPPGSPSALPSVPPGVAIL